MKTPREVLLARHQKAEPKLDALREQVLATISEAPRTKSSWVERCVDFWSNLFRRPRFAWGGLAAAWLVIIALNVASRETVTTTAGPVPEARRTPETLQALREQRRLFAAELVGSAGSHDADAPRFVPRPRSEGTPPIACA